MPDTNACCAADVNGAAASAGKWLATSSAEASDDCTAACAGAGNPATLDPSAALYRDAAMLPSTATPRAAPSSRVASFMADPAPARRGGTADMIAAVIGDIVNAIPDTRNSMQHNTYG
jgi:hypothetical protein